MTPQQLAKIRESRDGVHKLAAAYDLVIANEERAMNGHAVAQFPNKLRAALAHELPEPEGPGGRWNGLTQTIYNIIAARPDVAFTIHQVRAELNGSGESFTREQLSGALSRLKVRHFLRGGFGKYRVNPRQAPLLALPPAPPVIDVEARIAKQITRKVAKRHAKKPRAKKTSANHPGLRRAAQQRGLLLLGVLDKARTREEIIEALRGANRKRSIIDATTIANSIGPLVRRGYIKRDGETYQKVKDYVPRGA